MIRLEDRSDPTLETIMCAGYDVEHTPSNRIIAQVGDTHPHGHIGNMLS